MVIVATETRVRRTTPGMSALLWTAGALVALAGLQLFVFTERTDRYFAWTIDTPLTAAFLGASYWASLAFQWTAARRRVWAEARIAVPTAFTFTSLTFVATMLHIDRFHLGSEFETATQVVTWFWIAVYATVPVMMAVLAMRQWRAPGADPARAVRLPVWLRGLVVGQALVLAPVGIGLLLAPGQTGSWWPWELTPLTARAIGAWVFSLAVAQAHAAWEDDIVRLRPATAAYLAFGLLQLVALARYPDDMSWNGAAGVGYVAFLASTLVVGTTTWWLDRGSAGKS